MELLTSIIDLDSIQIKNSLFNPVERVTQIDALANTIVDLGGLVNIPVVQKINIDDYQLISGFLEYYAYLKARELNPRLPDRITVFISNNKNQAAIRQQLEILQTLENKNQTLSQQKPINQSEVDLQIKNIESSIKNISKNLLTVMENLKTELKAELIAIIDAKLPQSISPLDAFNRILEPDIAYKVQRKLELLLNASKAKKVVARLQEASKSKKYPYFQNFSEILELLKESQKGRLVSLISKEKMIQIIDRWND
ncbi:hypothetical protein [Scytonema sp. NUACC26]|uniref:hypothetical protein n=1 Tax=Scytonema sp. NUACC26 TaxID=3140176 RepID=UPI0034DC5D86